MTVLFAPEAEADFRAGIEYLVGKNPSAASQLADRVFAVIDQLARGDFEGPQSELKTGEQVLSFDLHPLRIYYLSKQGALWVLRIYDQRRQSIER